MIVGDKVDIVLHLQAGMSGAADDEVAGAAFGESGFDVSDRGIGCNVGKAGWSAE